MWFGIILLQLLFSSPGCGHFGLYCAVKSIIGYPPVPPTSQKTKANIVDGLTHTFNKAGGGAKTKKVFKEFKKMKEK